MLKLWIILAAVCCADSASTFSKLLNHGDLLSLDLPERTVKLEFTSADEKNYVTVWQRRGSTLGKATTGTVYSATDGLTFQLRQITFNDEGTYTLYNSFNQVIFSYVVTVNAKRALIECVPGETLSISLEGIKAVDATLQFYTNQSHVTLVEKGVPVTYDLDYIQRIKISSDRIKVLNVNVSDVGRYQLTDRNGRLVSSKTMILVDQHSSNSSKGLLALLLLGIPGTICFCCRKKICKCCREDKSQTDNGNTLNPMPESVPICHPVTDPSQSHSAGYPALPDQSHTQYPPPNQSHTQYPPPDQSHIQYPPPQWNGQPAVSPNPGFNTEYGPQNPVYPPGPVGPPIQPPQWNGPPNQYNPPAPVNYNMAAPQYPPAAQPTTYNMNESSPMMGPQSNAPNVSGDIPNSSAAHQFNVDMGKSSTSNFL